MVRFKVLTTALIIGLVMFLFSCSVNHAGQETEEKNRKEEKSKNVIENESVDMDTQSKAVIYEKPGNNSSLRDAQRIYDGDIVYGKISDKGDVDFYKVRFSRSGKVNFYLGNIPSGKNHNLFIYSRRGSILAFSTDKGNKSEKIYNYLVQANSTYYIKIRASKNYNFKKRYKLKVRMTTKQPVFTYNNIKNVMDRKGYRFYQNNKIVNLIAIRNSSRKAGPWDDYLCILYKENGRKKIKVFNEFTTDPGRYYLISKLLHKDGCAILKKGQYRGVYALGRYKGRKALMQTGSFRVYRDYNRDKWLDIYGDEWSVKSGIHLHEGNPDENPYVDTASAGSQAIRFYSDMLEIYKLCQRSGKKTFTYTLLNANDIIRN